jgi:glycosyltransferase involved in cell wall biosynthesis
MSHHPEPARRSGRDRSPTPLQILILTEAGDVWPSGRNRALLYADCFRRDSLDVHYRTRLSVGLTRLATGTGLLWTRLLGLGFGRCLAWANRIVAALKEPSLLRLARRCDVVYLEKTPSAKLVAALRQQSGARLVYDLNDAVWLPWMQRFLGSEVLNILRSVDMVTCDNRYGQEFARGHNPQGMIVPEPALVELFDRRRDSVRRTGDPVVIGWVGSPTTAFNLFAIWEPLELLFERFDNIVLRLVGVGHDWRLLPRFEKVRVTQLIAYDEDDLVREVLQMDIGLFPLFNVEDSYARGVHKPTVYMAGEACVVATGLGENCDLIQSRVNGFLARTNEEWLETLSELIRDPELRRRAARAGLQTARRDFSIERCYQFLKEALLPPASRAGLEPPPPPGIQPS